MGEDAAAGTGHLMIIGLRHHNDHEARACPVMRPNRSLPDQPHEPGTCNRPAKAEDLAIRIMSPDEFAELVADLLP
jgi:hypothetical protein